MSVPHRAAAPPGKVLNTSPSRSDPAVSRTDRRLRLFAFFTLALGVPSGVVGFALNDALALALSGVLIGLALLAIDVSRVRRGGLSPITLYVFSWTITSIANTLAIMNQDTSDRALFFIYAIDEHLPLAMKISWLGLVVPALGFHWVMRSPVWQALGTLMPRVRGHIPRDRLLRACVAAAALGIAANMTGALAALGTLTGIVYFLPHLAAFTLARAGLTMKWPLAVWIGLTIAGAEAVRALLTAYLRSDILSPIFAYAVGLLMGGRSLRILRSIHMAPVYAVVVPFFIYFAAFAEVRGTSAAGVDRLWAVAEAQQIQEETQAATRHNLIARLSSLNQLTQLGRLVQEDGFLNGATLEYLAYAWIPRFLWPEKPTIAKGAWFALRIGQARIHNGRITNSVNMTIPGELYLNFGWAGLLLGGLFFGGLLALFWSTTGFWTEQQNVLGAAFGFYLLWVGLGAGADLQLIVTLVAMYVVFVAASLPFRSAGPVPRVPGTRGGGSPRSNAPR